MDTEFFVTSLSYSSSSFPITFPWRYSFSMALFSKTLLAFFNHSDAPNRNPVTRNSKPFSLASSAGAHKDWSLSPDNTLSFRRLDLTNHGTEHYEEGFRVQHAQKMEVCKCVLKKRGADPLRSLCMIDAVQRLGIDNYFQEEIESILVDHHVKCIAHTDCGYELHETALRFRLLRQRGYYVSADMFNNFQDKHGNFNKELSENINALMALYEASQLRIEGENILDEAGKFSEQLLKARVRYLDDNQARLVGNTLSHPFHKSLARFMAKNFFGDSSNKGWLSDFQQLAKMDFIIVQAMHQNEVLEISKWWTEHGLAKKLFFAKDQPLKWHLVSMACLTDPNLSDERVELSKPISLIYILDDIFDVYGTLEELTLFTEAINKWDFAAVQQLPEGMKICFKVLYNITNEISDKIYHKHGWNPIGSLRKTWVTLCNAFLVEAQWLASRRPLKSEEYLRNAVVSSGVHVVLVHIFFLLGQRISMETVELVNNMPSIISSTATILRLWDDLGSAMDEDQDGRDGSYIDFYIKEHQGSSVKDAQEKVFSMISDAWKNLNKECLCPNPFPEAFTEASLNLARLVPLLYGYDNDHSLPSLEQHMNFLLFDSMPL